MGLDEELEALRKDYLKRDIIWKIASIVSVIIPFVYFGLFIAKVLPATFDITVYLLIALILLVIIFTCVYMMPIFLKLNKYYREYSKAYKNAYLRPVLEDAFKGGDYDIKEKVSLKDITEMSMLKKAKSAVANDCVSGSFKGIKFQRYDLALTYGKNKNASDCVLIVCNVKVPIKGELQIVSNQFKIGNNAYEMPDKLQVVKTGKDSFDKKYAVYASNESEALGFVKTSLIKKLEKVNLGGAVATFYEHNRVYAVIRRNKDVMEAPIYKSVSKVSAQKEAQKEIEVIKDWIDIVHSEIEG